MMHRRIGVMAMVLALGTTACGARYLSGTNVAEEAEIPNAQPYVEIMQLITDYEDILERRAFSEISALVSRDYYENGGTTDRTEDDYGQAGVAAVLTQLQDNIEDMRIEMRVHNIEVQGERADVFMEFGLTMLYRVGSESRWQTARDVNRLQLQREDDRWKIVSGL